MPSSYNIFFLFFFYIYFIQIYNPKFRNLIYMEKFFFLLKVTIKPPHTQPNHHPQQVPAFPPLQLSQSCKERHFPLHSFSFLFFLSCVWMLWSVTWKTAFSKETPQKCLLFFFHSHNYASSSNQTMKKSELNTEENEELLKGGFERLPNKRRYFPGKSLENCFRKTRRL